MSTLCTILLSAAMAAAPGTGPGTSPVKIEALLPGSSGFIVLRNTSELPVDLDGWSVRSCTGTGSAELAALPPGSTLPGGERFLIAGEGSAGTIGGQVVVRSITGSGAMLVRRDRTRADGVAFTTDSPCRENEASSPCGRQPLGRDENSTDTDNNRVDFSCRIS
ncbi:lamin tail domain-containing protein [Amycolatopsis nigrescens]|uniref:lamin tail domain-containing protein n=1 Tax=Amycolatopsis nigrescens TaxID=381445 RepID=UPI0003783802|nr:lamin tail domain-containing protein [Amycolatopsis nigrescens]